MIDERMEEQAALYALGSLPPEEMHAFEIAMRGDPELQRLVAALSTTATALAGTVTKAEPPPELKHKILAQIDRGQKIVPMPQTPFTPSNFLKVWFPWALAACLMVTCMMQNSRYDEMRTRRDDAVRDLLNSKQSVAEFQHAIEGLQHATNDLQHTILALQETNRLANMRIAMLGSLLSDQPKAVAVSLWDQKNQTGVFVVQDLKPPPDGKDYQLWVIDPQYGIPVDAGVFKVDAEGKVRFEFKAKQLIKTANKFAVTEEQSGGSPTPKGTMVMVGG